MFNEISDILWPSLAWQILPRDAENLNLRTVRVGKNHIYATVFINLFPKDMQTFVRLFAREPYKHEFFGEFHFCLKAMGWKEQVFGKCYHLF